VPGEDYLISHGWGIRCEYTEENAPTVRRAVQLIQKFIRGEAQAIHTGRKGAPQIEDFKVQYGAALLYSTLRTIGYPRLSGFKRLLAVYSAAKAHRVSRSAPPVKVFIVPPLRWALWWDCGATGGGCHTTPSTTSSSNSTAGCGGAAGFAAPDESARGAGAAEHPTDPQTGTEERPDAASLRCAELVA